MGMLDKVKIRDRGGRELKQYALITREKMLEALEAMVADNVPWRHIHSARVARTAGKAPATFYHYWPSVEAAFLVLMNERALEDRQMGPRFYAIRQFLIGEMQGYECDHVYEYAWDAEAHVSRGTCQKCGDETVVNHVE